MNQTIREYLCNLAKDLDRRPIPDSGDADVWIRRRDKRVEEYLDVLGLTDFVKGPRSAPLAKTTCVHERPDYRIENLYYESFPGVYVAASLYVPRGLADGARSPGVLYLCGHAPSPRYHYQEHPDQLARLGFVVLVTDTVMFGESTGVHHGLYNRGWWHWTSLGYNPAAAEIGNGVCSLDLLERHPNVDPERIGVTGISGGGGMSWWLGAADERVAALAAVCGTGTNARQILDRTIDGQCDCLLFPNPLGWDFPDVYALMAPRPALICATEYDDVYSPAGSRSARDKIATVYASLGAADQLEFLLTPSAHAYDAQSRSRIGAFFLRRLCGMEPAEADRRVSRAPSRAPGEPEDVFTVYAEETPPENRIFELHATIVPPPSRPHVESAADLQVQRSAMLERLRERTFRHFSKPPCPLDPREETVWAHGKDAPLRTVRRISFQSEPGWRLLTELHTPAPPDDETERPLLVVLRSPNEKRWASEGFVARFARGTGSGWNRAFLETRGVGETAWGRDIQWHVRRALPLLGRTIASLRVYDALRAIQLFRELPGVDEDTISLAARGEMAVVALFAALLDGRVPTVVLQNPPASLIEPGAPDGSSPATELLHALRYCDVSHIPLYLWPTEIVYVGSPPQSYAWANDAYRRLGEPGAIRCLQDLGEWRR